VLAGNSFAVFLCKPGRERFKEMLARPKRARFWQQTQSEAANRLKKPGILLLRSDLRGILVVQGE
jgi:hypothetical protein